jgi:hypothetical protein
VCKGASLVILQAVLATASHGGAAARTREGNDMEDVSSLNNQADQLITAGRLDDADRVLDRVRAVLDRRPRAVPNAQDLGPAMDEYFYRVHRLIIAWHRAQYAKALPHAQRAWELETGLLAAARDTQMGLEPVATSAGAWGIISVLTRLRRFAEAEQHFKAVLADSTTFFARVQHDRAAAEKILLAGLCMYFEANDRRFFEQGRSVVAQAQAMHSAADRELEYGYASYWARLGEPKPAIDALASALSLGIDPERAFADEDFRSLQADARFQALVTERIFTWKIGSQPPGARVWLDGVDTGQDTPARLRPPAPGRHVIRLTLAGHREASDELRQEKDMGLNLVLPLESLASIALRQKMADDSVAVPSPAAKARTRAFLGPRASWGKARVVMIRGTTYGLGELVVTVQGDGRASARHTEFADPRRQHEAAVQLSAQEVDDLFTAFVEEAFTEMVFANQAGHPDEIYLELRLANAEGKSHELGKFASLEHKRFDQLLQRVVTLVAGHLDKKTRTQVTLP